MTAQGKGGSSDLLERIEGAERGSRDLDCLMGLFARTDGKGEIVVWHDGQPTLRDGGGVYAPQAYTTSLDAALALAERLGLDAWTILYSAMMDWRAHIEGQSLSARLPLLVCAAILRARGEPKTGEGGVS